MVVATALTALSLLTSVHGAAEFALRATGSLDSWLATETPIALQGVLNNIGSSGAFTNGADEGIVIASPSMQDPDCKLSCFRYRSLINAFASPDQSNRN